jgi:hypothetical protein
MGTFRRIFKPVKHIDWSYAVGEIILIFLGISLAIWFNNWNEARNDRRTEVNLLKEIQENLVANIRHTNSISVSELKRAAAYRRLGTLIKTDQLPGTGNAMRDTLTDLLIDLNSYANYFPRTAGFQSLRSWGIHRLTTDSIRKQLTNLHEKDIVSIQDAMQNNFEVYMEIYHDHILRHTDFSGPGIWIRDMDQFLADEDFANKLFAMAIDREMSMKYFVIPKIRDMERIEVNLRKELARLE